MKSLTYPICCILSDLLPKLDLAPKPNFSADFFAYENATNQRMQSYVIHISPNLSIRFQSLEKQIQARTCESFFGLTIVFVTTLVVKQIECDIGGTGLN